MSTRSSSRTSARASSRSTRLTAVLRDIQLTSLFRPEDILHNCSAADDTDVMRRLLTHLALEQGIGNLNAALREVEANLEKDSPHIVPGLAIAYGRLEKIAEPLVAMATFPGGRDFAGSEVYLVFVILIPHDMPGVYKQIVHSLEKTCGRDAATPAAIAAMTSPLAVWQHFEEKGHKLPDHLNAGHIMTSPSIFLRGDDNLARAIDMFLAHHTTELPVINADHELIGVVTTRRLIKVCMPDYLSWVEDLRPFQNFEPIAEIIRKESTTWLREIMVQNFAHVSEDSPAILALREIGRRETDNAYVLRGRTLVGVIHLHEFLKSILR